MARPSMARCHGAEVMGVMSVAGSIANGGVALMLYRFRPRDTNMRSVLLVQ